MVGWTWVWAKGEAAGLVSSAGLGECPRGVMVRCRAARTLCSIWERLAEYIDRFSTDFRLSTKNTAAMPTSATIGPARRYAIGADYPGSALCLASRERCIFRALGARPTRPRRWEGIGGWNWFMCDNRRSGAL